MTGFTTWELEFACLCLLLIIFMQAIRTDAQTRLIGKLFKQIDLLKGMKNDHHD